MLNKIREYNDTWMIKSILWTIILAFLGTIFYSWGMGGAPNARGGVVATVGGVKIKYSEYDKTFNNLINFYREQFRNQFSDEMIIRLNLKEQALNALIQKNLLLQEADRQNIGVSDEELRKHIQEIPGFQKDNDFNEEFYNNYLQRQRLAPMDFEESQREQLILTKIENLIKTSTKVSESEILVAFKADQQKIKLDYVIIPRNHFKLPDSDTISDAELQEFFEKEKRQFEVPEQFKVKYIKVEPKVLAEDIVPNDEDIQDYYATHISDFKIKKMFEASHILIKPDPSKVELGDDASEEDKLKAAEKEAKTVIDGLLDQINSGTDFAELAKEHSEDPGSGPKGGSLGEFPKGTMVKEFGAALEKLKVNEISEPVKTFFGYHIIRLEGVKEPRTKPLDEVKDSIVESLKQSKSRQKARRMVRRIHKNAKKSGNFAEAAKEKGVEVKESELFSREKRNLIDVGTVPEFYNAAFNLMEKDISEPVNTFEASYLITMIEKKAPYIPQLDKVREDVSNVLLKNKNTDFAKSQYKEIQNKFAGSTDLEAVAKEQNLKVKKTPFFSASDSIPGIGNIQAIKDKVFDLEKGKATSVTALRQLYLVRVEEIKDAPTPDQKQKDDVYTRLIRQKGDAVFRDWLDKLRERSEVLIDETLL
jgi:peptidyl-prolyl cis-trans isomerase D